MAAYECFSGWYWSLVGYDYVQKIHEHFYIVTKSWLSSFNIPFIWTEHSALHLNALSVQISYDGFLYSNVLLWIILNYELKHVISFSTNTHGKLQLVEWANSIAYL